MDNSFLVPKNVRLYLRRIISEYKRGDMEEIAEIIQQATPFVREDSYDEAWGDSHGHELILFLSEEWMKKIPLHDQSNIEERLQNDLNTAIHSISGEFFWNVRFDYKDKQEENGNLDLIRTRNSKDEERIWGSEPIRLFISHRDSVKTEVHELASNLRDYGVSAFVAHDAIEPDEDWQKEIEIALQSMEAMLAYISDDFFGSVWTNQEIGYALARQVPVISIKFGQIDPAGFIRHKQAIRGDFRSAKTNAKNVHRTLQKKIPELPRYRAWVIDEFVNAGSFNTASAAFKRLRKITDIQQDELLQLVDAFNSNNQLHNCFALLRNDRFLKWVNGHGIYTFEVHGHEIKAK